MTQIHVLVRDDGQPIAAAERFERLSLRMANYTAIDQARLSIFAVEVLT